MCVGGGGGQSKELYKIEQTEKFEKKKKRESARCKYIT